VEGDVEIRTAAFAALTHVCRQIRREYRPVQRRQAETEIDLEDMPAYLATFHSSTEDSAIVPRRLLIALQPVAVEVEACKISGGIDFRHLLRLQDTWRGAGHPSICEFKPPDTRPNIDDIGLPGQMPRDHIRTAKEYKDLQVYLDHTDPVWLDHIRHGQLATIKIHRDQWSTSHFMRYISLTFMAGHGPNFSIITASNRDQHTAAAWVLEKFGLGKEAHRAVRCFGLLIGTDEADVDNMVEEYVRAYRRAFGQIQQHCFR